MIYACKIHWFFEDEITHDEVFIVADSISSCVELINDHYDEETIDLVTIESIAGVSIMPIAKDSSLFESVKDNIKKQAIW